MNFKPLPLLAIAALLSGVTEASAQKKEMDHSVYDSWQSVSDIQKSDDGNVLVWCVNPQEGGRNPLCQEYDPEAERQAGMP